MIKKISIFILMFLSLFSLSFALTSTTTYTETNGISWSYERWSSSSDGLNLFNTQIAAGGPFAVTGDATYTVQSGYARIFRFPSLTEDYIFKKATTDLSVHGSSSANFYFTGYTGSELTSPNCNLNYDSYDQGTKTLTITSNLKPLQGGGSNIKFSGQKVHLINSPIEHLLKKYYYMKSEIKFVLFKDGLPYQTYYPTNDPYHVTSRAGYTNFIQVKPETSQIDFTNLPDVTIANGFPPGLYEWHLDLAPIDGKCTGFSSLNTIVGSPIELPGIDLFYTPISMAQPGQPITFQYNTFGMASCEIHSIDTQGNSDVNSVDHLATSETISLGHFDTNYTLFCRDSVSNTYIYPTVLEVKIDSDLDGIPDSDDLCPSTPGTPGYTGCSTEYTAIHCTGSLHFNPNTSLVYNSDYHLICGNMMAFKTTSAGPIQYKNGNDYMFATFGSGYYYGGEDDDFIGCGSEEPTKDGYCKLRHNAYLRCIDHVSGFTLANGHSTTLFKHKNRLPVEQIDPSFQTTIACISGSFDDPSKLTTHPSFSTKNLGEDYKDFQRNITTGKVYREDQTTNAKISCDSLDKDENNCNINLNNVDIPITLPTTNVSNQIKLYKNGVNTKNETIDPKLIAMNVHAIKTFSTKDKIENYVQKSYTLMHQMQIEKHIDAITSPGNTRVRIDIKNIPESDQTDLVIYQIISKDDLSNFDNLKIINNSNGQFIVEDKDPVIGWYFNETGDDESIEYEIPGTSEGGVIIITQEPILLNDGELVINYRENGCQGDEVALFDLEALDHASVTTPNSAQLYTVCLTHVDSSIASSISTTLQGSDQKDILQFLINLSYYIKHNNNWI